MPNFDFSQYLVDIEKVMLHSLQAAVRTRVYYNYQPIKQSPSVYLSRSMVRKETGYKDYLRSYALLNSIDVQRVSQPNGRIKLFVGWDRKELALIEPGEYGFNKAKTHYFNVHKWKNINKGSFVFVPMWVNEGYHYSWRRKSGTPPKRSKPQFMEKSTDHIYHFVKERTRKMARGLTKSIKR